ncbi:zinc finger CCCH domain-containing protein [Trifolium repens]|nr:zinc finger CCCH domain-containing protein [Trifolium repens]KAK2390718.1 zinc finger CCCH domain-containing protein [Trifolium repens]
MMCLIKFTNANWAVGQTAVNENRSSNSRTSVVTPSYGDNQTRYGNNRFSVPRDRGFPGHGREPGLVRGRAPWNRQPVFGVGNGGSYRPPPRGQRVCKFYESGYFLNVVDFHVGLCSSQVSW